MSDHKHFPGYVAPLPVVVDEDGYDWYVGRDRKPQSNLHPVFQGIFDSFLSYAVNDTVNNGSGGWEEPEAGAWERIHDKELEARDRESRDVDPDEGCGFIGGPEED